MLSLLLLNVQCRFLNVKNEWVEGTERELSRSCNAQTAPFFSYIKMPILNSFLFFVVIHHHVSLISITYNPNNF
jgi:hypothetical protein